jgi:lipoprotein NlpI
MVLSLLLFTSVLALSPLEQSDKAAELMAQAREARTRGEADRALMLAGKAIEADPRDPRSFAFRGKLFESLGRFGEAEADLTRALELAPMDADRYDERGSVRFKRGLVVDAVADFDQFLVLRPEQKAGHWRRGIALYYAGKFDEGRKQFNAYEKVDTNDVENAVWHFLCTARASSVDKARAEMLKIGKDRRVPMTEVYELFHGDLKPEAVLAAAEAGDVSAAERHQRLFYAHLYLGLYYEVMGEARQARPHLEAAAGKYRIAHYMGDVARVHVLLRDGQGK